MTDVVIAAREIIKDRFKGRRDVASITGATPNAVAQWYRIGIPPKYWPVLVDVARDRGVQDVTFDALAATKPSEAA